MTSRPFTPTEQELADILTGKQAQFCRPIRLPGYPDRAHEFRNPRIIKPGIVEFNWEFLGVLSSTLVKCPFGARYDTLWIKEKCTYAGYNGRVLFRYWLSSTICAKHPTVIFVQNDPRWDWVDKYRGRWCPAIAMPKWASRHSLNMLKVGVEQVAYTWMWVVDFEVIK